MYESIWIKDTKYMIEIPIYCDKVLDINIAIINLQSKITRNNTIGTDQVIIWIIWTKKDSGKKFF